MRSDHPLTTQKQLKMSGTISPHFVLGTGVVLDINYEAATVTVWYDDQSPTHGAPEPMVTSPSGGQLQLLPPPPPPPGSELSEDHLHNLPTMLSTLVADGTQLMLANQKEGISAGTPNDHSTVAAAQECVQLLRDARHA